MVKRVLKVKRKSRTCTKNGQMQNKEGFSMKNIVITGSTRGSGFSMAVEFLKAGCNVTLSGRGETL